MVGIHYVGKLLVTLHDWLVFIKIGKFVVVFTDWLVFIILILSCHLALLVCIHYVGIDLSVCVDYFRYCYLNINNEEKLYTYSGIMKGEKEGNLRILNVGWFRVEKKSNQTLVSGY